MTHRRRCRFGPPLKTASIEVRSYGGARARPVASGEALTEPAASKPATSDEVITPSCLTTAPLRARAPCAPFRELITAWIDDGRTAMSVW